MLDGHQVECCECSLLGLDDVFWFQFRIDKGWIWKKQEDCLHLMGFIEDYFEYYIRNCKDPEIKLVFQRRLEEIKRRHCLMKLGKWDEYDYYEEEEEELLN